MTTIVKKVEIYSKRWCGYCRMAKMLLDKNDVEYEEYDVTSDSVKESEMRERSGRGTVPQIFIDNESVGGFMELAALSQATDIGELIRSGKVEEPN